MAAVAEGEEALEEPPGSGEVTAAAAVAGLARREELLLGVESRSGGGARLPWLPWLSWLGEGRRCRGSAGGGTPLPLLKTGQGEVRGRRRAVDSVGRARQQWIRGVGEERVLAKAAGRR